MNKIKEAVKEKWKFKTKDNWTRKKKQGIEL